MIKKIDHIAIAVRDLDQASKFYTEHLGLTLEGIEEVPGQKVRVAFIPIGDTRIELVEPTSPDSPISKYLEKRGEGLHHICLETNDVHGDVQALADSGVRLIDSSPREGAHNTQIAFVHPKANAGVLTELAEHPSHAEKGEALTLDYPTLRRFFESSYKPREQWQLGVEYELSGIKAINMAPLTFYGEHEIEGLMKFFREKYGEENATWENGFCFGMDLPYGQLTLEPGGQIEFSSKPLACLHKIDSSFQLFLKDLETFGKPKGIRYYTAGVNPFHAREEMSWSPKPRYKIMRAYLGENSKYGHYMMQQTMSLQYNIDFSDHTDAIRKYQASRLLQPTLLFLSSNSKIYNGEPRETDFRGEIWEGMDPTRSGIPPEIKHVDEYIDYALDVPMFFIKRQDEWLPAENGLTFREFLRRGFKGHKAVYGDWELHLSTLFPEVRFKKNALELRMFDSNKPEILLAFTALIKAIFYNKNRTETQDHLDPILEGTWNADWESCEKAYQLALEGIEEGEAHYLNPLKELIEQRQTPGDLTKAFFEEHNNSKEKLLERLEIKTNS